MFGLNCDRKVEKAMVLQNMYSILAGLMLGLMTASAGAATKMLFVHTDHLGTPQVLTDNTQTIVWKANYTPFGEAEVDEDPDGDGVAVEMPLRFPGQYFDKETGLSYNYYRDYDPSLGRYVQSDPIGLAGGINTYAYVGGNPIKYVDPEGLVYGLGNGPWSQSNTVSDLAQEDTFSPNSECVMQCKVVSIPVCISVGATGGSFTAGIGTTAGLVCNFISNIICKSECDDMCPNEVDFNE